jgi:hypothetical protein
MHITLNHFVQPYSIEKLMMAQEGRAVLITQTAADLEMTCTLSGRTTTFCTFQPKRCNSVTRKGEFVSTTLPHKISSPMMAIEAASAISGFVLC